MPSIPLGLVFGMVLACLAWHVWKTVAQRNSDNAFAAQQGCLPIKTIVDGKWPLGLDTVKGIYNANATQHLMAYAFSAFGDKGPTFELRMLGNVGIFTVDPENIEYFLSKSKFRDGELDFVYGMRRPILLPLFGEGIFTQDGPAWKHSRAMLRKQFTRIQSDNLDLFTEHVDLLVSRIASSKTSVIDLQPLFFNFTLDTTTSLLFGESAGSLNEHSQDEFGKNLNEASWFSVVRVQLAYLYWLCCFPRFYRACDKVREYADRWIQKALDGPDGASGASGNYDFVQDLYDELQDRGLVRDQLVNVLLAGRDTTASLLSWTFRLLVRHPRVLDKLRKEIEDVQDGDKFVTKEKLRNMPYLKNVVTESLRVYPPVPMNSREAGHTTILPRGGGPDGLSPILIKKGVGVAYAPYFMHRRTDLYGEDCFDFRPERWEDGTLHENMGWGYLPFHGGPRVCLGQEFALREASYAIIRIVQAFPALGLPADEKVEPVGSERQTLTLTLAPADGCRVRIRE